MVSTREQLEEVAAAYQRIGLTVEESYLAAGLECRLSEGKPKRFSEQNTVPANQSPLDKLGIVSAEFTATAAVLEKLGYQLTSSNEKDREGKFTRAASASFIVKMDGSFFSPDLANKQVCSGVNAFQLAILLGVTT